MAYTKARRELNAAEQYLGAGANETISLDDVAAGEQSIEIIDRVLPKDKLEAERFMAEKIDILVHETNDESEGDYVETWVNGRIQMFRRGVVQTVRRCYAESLARAKRTTYKQDLDDRAGEAGFNRMHKRTALHYPFSVVRDPNPMGVAWFQALMARSV